VVERLTGDGSGGTYTALFGIDVAPFRGLKQSSTANKSSHRSVDDLSS
jgi:hypothetical protein